MNSAERAYHMPYFTLATVCAKPTGSTLSSTISIRPILMAQKANLIQRSFHCLCGSMLFSTNSISPMPSMPYTPNRAV